MRRAAKISALFLLLCTALVLLGLGVFELAAVVSRPYLPEVVTVEELQANIWLASRIRAADSTLLSEIYKERRTYVPLSEIPRHLVDAVVAAEDGDFFSHRGVDWLSVARALAVGAVKLRFTQGGSTITQQLARNLYLSRERTLKRKLIEALMARKIESTLSKDEILEQYLNLIYWGHGAFGIGEASAFYFGKHPSGLTPTEAIMLAGIISSPETFSPLRNPDATLRRMRYVVTQISSRGAAEEGVALPDLYGRRPVDVALSPYGVDTALVELQGLLASSPPDTAGLEIRTYIDPSMQRAVNEGVNAALPALQQGLVTSPTEPGVLCTCEADGVVSPGCPVWAQVTQHEVEEGRVLTVFGRIALLPNDSLPRALRSSLAEATTSSASGSSPETMQAAPLVPGSYIKVLLTSEMVLSSPWLTEEAIATPVVVPQAAAVLLEHRTGRLKAVYGGTDHRLHPYNRALSARRPVGSTIKPFIYLAAMQQMGHTPSTEIDATPLRLHGAEGAPWSVRDRHPHGPVLSMTDAIAFSSNTAAVRTLRALTVPAFLQAWADWGLPPISGNDLSLALGTASLTPLELAEAYAFLATGKSIGEATIVAEVRDRYGREVEKAAAAGGGRLGTEAGGHKGAGEIRACLKDVVRRGTGEKAQVPGVEIAGKTGTSSKGRDAWFAGIVGDHVLVVWVGSDDLTELPDNSGPETAAVVFHEIVSRIYGMAPIED